MSCLESRAKETGHSTVKLAVICPTTCASPRMIFTFMPSCAANFIRGPPPSSASAISRSLTSSLELFSVSSRRRYMPPSLRKNSAKRSTTAANVPPPMYSISFVLEVSPHGSHRPPPLLVRLQPSMHSAHSTPRWPAAHPVPLMA